MGRIAATVVLVAGLVLAPAALADSTTSSNWAGYAVHHAGVSFRSVRAAWEEPTVTCTAGQRTFSSYWVGLGGFNPSSQDIEQLGTEADCTRFGAPKYTAWYELLPAPSRPIRLAIHAGDLVTASTTVAGHVVSFSLRDVTTGQAFAKALPAASVDISSAEWIVEAPSDCVSSSECVTLPLADFDSTSFLDATAQGSRGHWGSISHAGWDSTRITLDAPGQRFVTAGAAAVAGTASTGPLSWGGEAFTVSYAALPGATQTRLNRRAAIRRGSLVHPVRRAAA